ncbi:MAG: 23S rRNA (adenine2503-C2)-methyltransferase [Patiriisocius sp.]|jgi:23S rRNA (adenine2503-C2)-methyltransferase
MSKINAKKNIRSLTLDELIEYFKGIDEPSFRAKQVYQWLWNKSALEFDDMSNLSISLREKLKEKFAINSLTIKVKQKSKDGTFKYAFELYDGNIVEGVLIPTSKRITACISTQVGCSLTCKFCATGKLKIQRNLGYDEVYDQVVMIKNEAEKEYQRPLTNIVYMGMGEPLLNYKGTVESVKKITEDTGLGMASKRITISTAGIAKMIKKLGDDNVKTKLAISLHAANDEKRNRIMPINETNTLEILKEALAYYHEKTGLPVTYEYILFKGFNDSLDDADELAAVCRVIPCMVNLIEYNAIGDGEFQKTLPENTESFIKRLNYHGFVAKVRNSRGQDIDAACGQLANKEEKE